MLIGRFLCNYVESTLVADHDAAPEGGESKTEDLHRRVGLNNERLTWKENDPLDRLRQRSMPALVVLGQRPGQRTYRGRESTGPSDRVPVLEPAVV